MIQRIQTIYLLLALGMTSLLLLFPIFQVSAFSNFAGNVVASAELGANGLVFSENVAGMDMRAIQDQALGEVAVNADKGNFPVYISYIVMMLFALVAIFLFKNRKKQILVIGINLVLNILFVIGVMAFYYLGSEMVKEAFPDRPDLTVKFSLGLGFYFLVATIPFLILALRGIKRDENLVKSLERLR